MKDSACADDVSIGRMDLGICCNSSTNGMNYCSCMYLTLLFTCFCKLENLNKLV